MRIPALALLACAALACGSSSPVAPAPASDAPDASPATSDDAAPDAPDADDPGSDVYPAPHPLAPPMVDYGGELLADMKLVTVVFQGSPFQDAIAKFEAWIVGSQWLATVTEGYPGLGVATYAGVFALPDTVSNKTISDEVDLPALIQSAVDQHQLPAPDARTLYALHFPSSTTVTLEGDGSCLPGSFAAYHNSFALTVAGARVRTAYAVLPDCAHATPDPGFSTVATSHEIIEALTDPHPNADYAYYNWSDPWSGGDVGGEIADLCESYVPAYEGGYDLARAWSNAAIARGRNPCQPQPATQIYFAAAIHGESIVSDFGTGNDHPSDGYVLLHPGETRDVEVDVFSEAPLSGDLTLAVGEGPAGSTDPSSLTPIPGVTATLSRTKGLRNGNKVTLTLAAAPDVPRGDAAFRVRAILGSELHDWPAILHVF